MTTYGSTGGRSGYISLIFIDIHVDLIPNNPPYTACRVASLHWPGPQPFTSSALQVSCPNGETCTNSTSPCPNRDTFTNSTDCATPWTSQLFICK